MGVTMRVAKKVSCSHFQSITRTVKSVICKGKAPVDPECVGKINVAHVYFEGDNIYDVLLNQTNVQNNNTCT
ncbi:unnamed protein product [Trichobilharzia szidati]|nr:unnamed protein product [Trichobilharzia szidati]